MDLPAKNCDSDMCLILSFPFGLEKLYDDQLECKNYIFAFCHALLVEKTTLIYLSDKPIITVCNVVHRTHTNITW